MWQIHEVTCHAVQLCSKSYMPSCIASSVTAVEPKQEEMFALLAIYSTLHKNIILKKGVHFPKISDHTSPRKLPLGRNAVVSLSLSLHRAFSTLFNYTHQHLHIYLCYVRSLNIAGGKEAEGV